MTVSAFFSDLSSAYEAELDDLRSDSDGKDVLRKRLADKRAQLPFLCQMMDDNPELVAVAFHGGFHFDSVPTLEHLLRLDGDDLPPWDALTDAVTLTPWAQDLADVVLCQPGGERLLVLAAVLEYLQQRPRHAQRTGAPDDDATDPHPDGATHAARRGRHADDHDADDALDNDTDADAAEDWLQDQGFDRKE